MTALALAAPVVALIVVIAWALGVRAGHDQPARYAILRARWAWQCRGNPPLPAHETITEPERS